MKKVILLTTLLIAVVTSTFAYDVLNFPDQEDLSLQLEVGSGSGIGITKIDAWDKLYKTLSTEELAEKLERRVHRKYAAAKGWTIWTFTEVSFINQIKAKLTDVVAAPTAIAAWDYLYTNVETMELRWFITHPYNKIYAFDKGWLFTSRTEKAFIETLKLLLGNPP